MTLRRHASVIATVVLTVAAFELGGCSTVKNANPFRGHHDAAGPKTEAGQRISLLELNDQLKVSDSLKGQDFFLPPPQPQADWPLPGGSLEQSVEHVDAAPDFQIAWRRNFGAKSVAHADVMAPPIMADGKVFVMDGNAGVSAHDAKSGSPVWHVDLRPKVKKNRDREGFGGGLAYSDGKLYVTSGYRLVAQLDPSNGHVNWETHTDAPLHDAPTVSDGRVYVVDVDDELLSYNAATGVQDWTYQALTEPARMLVASSPAVSNGTLVASFASGELVALRSDNGTELWNVPLSHTTRTNALSEIRDIAGRPIIYKGDVFAVSHADVMAATDLRTGNVRWTIPLSGETAPWAAGDVVYAVDTAGEVVCAARDSGQLYWMVDLNAAPPSKKGKKPKRGRSVWSGPILASNRLILASDKGEVIALNPKTGAVEKQLKIGDDALLSPIAAGGMIYIATQKADLVALR